MEHVCHPPLPEEPCALGSGLREVLSCLGQPGPTPVPLLLHQHHHCPETAEKAVLITKINHPQGTGANLRCQNRPWVESGSAMGAIFPIFPVFLCFSLFSLFSSIFLCFPLFPSVFLFSLYSPVFLCFPYFPLFSLPASKPSLYHHQPRQQNSTSLSHPWALELHLASAELPRADVSGSKWDTRRCSKDSLAPWLAGAFHVVPWV